MILFVSHIFPAYDYLSINVPFCLIVYDYLSINVSFWVIVYNISGLLMSPLFYGLKLPVY